jgi:predicted MFS family arabinose efflux permease
VLTTYASWRWTLLVNVIIAAVAIGGAMPLLKRDRGTDHDPLDIQGVLSVTLGLFALVYGFSHVETTSWHDHYTVGSFVVAAVLLGYFFFVQKRTKFPLLPLRVIADRNRGGSLLAMLVAGVGMFGMFLFLTYFMQLTLGFSAVKTGLAFLPMIGGLILTAQVSNILLLPKVGPRPLIPLGMAMAAAGLFWLSNVTIHSSYTGGVLLPLILIGLAMGFIFAPSFNTATLGVAPHDAGVASALVNTSQQIGGSIGTALLNTLAASAATSFMVGKAPTALNQGMAAVHSYTTAFMISAWIFLGGAIAAAVVLRSGAPVHEESDVPVVAH